MPLTIKTKNKTVEIPDEERTRCEVWSRVMGYYRPVQDWNAGKKQEFRERRNFRLMGSSLGE